MSAAAPVPAYVDVLDTLDECCAKLEFVAHGCKADLSQMGDEAAAGLLAVLDDVHRDLRRTVGAWLESPQTRGAAREATR